MKVLVLLFLLHGCATPITANDWYFCEYVCGSHTVDVCRTMIDGLKCRCEYGGIIEIGEPPTDWDF